MKACISYDDLHDASQEAHKVAKRFDDYADELQRKVLNKLADYNGPWTSNMSNAYDLVSDKINELRTDYSRFEQYSIDLDELLDECKEVDKAVKTRVSQLTAAFKDANGISNSYIENFLAYTFTALCNSTAVGRFIGNGIDYFKAKANELFQTIKVWFNFEGGKQFIEAMLANILNIASAVIGLVDAIKDLLTAIAATIASEGAASPLIVFEALRVAAAVGNLWTTCVDSTVDIYHEFKALSINQNPEDAAMAYRLREINSFSDLMRNGYILDENDESWFNKLYTVRRWGAVAWDGIEIYYDTVGLVGSVGRIFTGGKVSFDFKSLIPFFGSIFEDGFQFSDLLAFDPTGAFSGTHDVGSGIYDLYIDNFKDRSIELDIIHKLGSAVDIPDVSPIKIRIPQIMIPSIQIPLIQIPHIPEFVGC